MSFRPFAAPGINFLRPVRVLKTESFRSAALFATLFLILSWVLLGVVYWIVNGTQTAALIGAVDADISTIRNGYREKGLSEAIEVVQQRLGSGDYSGADLPGGYILLQDQASGTARRQFAAARFSVRSVQLSRAAQSQTRLRRRCSGAACT